MYQTLNDLEMNIQENQEKQENSRKGKKRLKWILIGLGLIIGLGVLRFGSVFLIDYFMPSFPSNVLILIAWIFSILIALFVEILIIYFIYLRRTRKNGGSDKLKKRLKISLFVILPFLFLSAFSFFTKSGIIPNWFDIELLCSGKIDYIKEPDSDGNCPDGYELIYGKCHEEGWPHRGGSEVAGTIGCINCEYYDAAEECSAYYKMPKVKGYTQESYNAWVKEKHPEDPNGEKQKRKNKIKNSDGKGDLLFELIDPVDFSMRSEDLSRNAYYDERLDDKFDGYQEALKEYENHQNSCWSYTQVMKPIIYLYPTTEAQVNVELGTPQNLSHTYPKYNTEKGWNVIAQPNGDLEDMDTGRKLYALYREGKSDNETNFDEGFVVKGEDIIPFLEEKLAVLGLNEREAEEFIIYWLPQMENNERNLIRFETMEEQNENMPLNITPTPDTIIRVMMDWKAIDEPVDIPEQKLETPERIGFTAVEWGGSPRS